MQIFKNYRKVFIKLLYDVKYLKTDTLRVLVTELANKYLSKQFSSKINF